MQNNYMNDTSKQSPKFESWMNLRFDKDGNDTLVFIHVQKTGGTMIEENLVYNIKDSMCKCTQGRRLPNCQCFGRNRRDTWIINRFVFHGWPLGVHPDLKTSQKNSPNFMDKTYGKRNRRYLFAVFLRDPINRFVSEYLHTKRGADWTHTSSLCKGKKMGMWNPSCHGSSLWANLTLDSFMACQTNMAINRQTWMHSDVSKIGCDLSIVMTNSQKRRRLLHVAKKNLKNSAYIGLLEYPRESQFVFEKTFGVRFKENFFYKPTSKEIMDVLAENPKTSKAAADLNHLDSKLYDFAKTELFLRYNYFVSVYGEPVYNGTVLQHQKKRTTKIMPKKS